MHQLRHVRWWVWVDREELFNRSLILWHRLVKVHRLQAAYSIKRTNAQFTYTKRGCWPFSKVHGIWQNVATANQSKSKLYIRSLSMIMWAEPRWLDRVRVRVRDAWIVTDAHDEQVCSIRWYVLCTLSGASNHCRDCPSILGLPPLTYTQYSPSFKAC